MSHGRKRKEKDCLNCGATVMGRYCQVCGQENLEPKETFWGMVLHFFGDITHFDGKFFTTLKILMTKPGFLSAEYMRGRRATYLNPVRMYVFTSFIFFLIFFSLKKPDDVIKFEGDLPFTLAQRDSVIRELKKDFSGDSTDINFLGQLSLLQDTTKIVRPSDLIPFVGNYTVIGTAGRNYTSRKNYDSIQSSLPASQRDGWLKRLWNRKAISLNEKYQYRGKDSIKDIVAIFLHNLPYLLFVSLPFFALILKLLYVRRKQFYYADHGIFSIHHYIFSFILLLVVFLFNELGKMSGWGIFDFFIFITLLGWPVYLFIAMRRFYRQGKFKTFIKFFLLNILGFIVLTILFLFFGLFSVFQM